MVSCSEGNNSLFRVIDDGTLCLSLFLCFLALLALFFFLGVSTSILAWSSISEDRGAGSGGVSPGNNIRFANQICVEMRSLLIKWQVQNFATFHGKYILTYSLVPTTKLS